MARSELRPIDQFIADAAAGKMTRRQLMPRGAALGLSASAIGMALRGAPEAALAQAAEPSRPDRDLAVGGAGDARELERLQPRRAPGPAQHLRGAAQPRSGHQRAGRRAGHRLGVAGRPHHALHPARGRDLPRRLPFNARGRRRRRQLHLVRGERLRHHPVHGTADQRRGRRRDDDRRLDRGAGPDPAGASLLRAAAEHGRRSTSGPIRCRTSRSAPVRTSSSSGSAATTSV